MSKILPPSKKSARGREAESLVVAFLELKNWKIEARNWKRGRGELDIVASKNDILAVVEVKVIDAYGFESLEQLINKDKQKRIVETSKLFLSNYREFTCMQVRFDVATVVGDRVSDYLENAFAE